MTTTMIITGILTLITACGVVFAVKPLHSALYLVATLFLVAIHFALLNAGFIAALQVLIYAGAIMVLVIFVIMLLGYEKKLDASRFRFSNYLAALVAGGFAGLLVFAIQYFLDFSFDPGPSQKIAFVEGDASAVGYVLFKEYLYAFELASLLLLAAIIGAVVLSYQPRRPLTAGRGLQAKQSSNTQQSEAPTQ